MSDDKRNESRKTPQKPEDDRVPRVRHTPVRPHPELHLPSSAMGDWAAL